MLPASSRFRSVRAKFMNDANDKLNYWGAPFQGADVAEHGLTRLPLYSE